MDTQQPPVFAGNSEPRQLRYMSRDLVTGLMIVVIAAASLVMLVNYLIAAQKADRALEQEADQYLSYLSKSLELPIWSMDDKTVNQIGNAFMTSEKFALLEIIAHEYEKIYIYQNQKAGEDNMVLRRGKLEHGNQAIGSIRIGLSRIPHRNEIRRLLYSSLLITAVITIVMASASWLMLRRFVRQSLHLLMDVTSQMARGNYESRVKNIKHHEISMVYEQLITMAVRVKGREASLADANIQLKKEIERRGKTEQELRNLRNYMTNIIDSMPSMLVGVDTDGRVTQWNKTVEKITGISADGAKGRNITDMLPQMALEMKNIKESIRTRQVIQEQKRPRQLDDSTCYEDVTVYPLVTNGVEGAVIRIDDVTERVRLEEMMIQSEKMISVGGLAAGMAHEINNPLAGMMQTAEVMANRLGSDFDIPANRKAAEAAGTTMKAVEGFMKARDIPRMITNINQSGRRLASIVDNMLSFARKGDSWVSSYLLEDLLDKTLELAATDYDLKKHYDFKMIEIIKEYADKLPAVPCEAAKIQQVLLNILSNGAQAMQAGGVAHPRFTIRTWFDKGRDMACMEIEDNGPGMDEATRKRVFEPFFTTKPAGIGTGLGLSVSYFIITENHRGEMAVESRPGAGAKFIIRLPVGV